MAVKSLKNGGTYANAYANAIALADLLIVGGGGGGSKVASVYSGGQGGGAGGLLFKESYSINPGSYAVVIGAGGAGGTGGTSGTSYEGAIGSQSSFGSLIAYGGGGGASGDSTSNGIYGGGSEGGSSTLLPGVWNQSGFVQGQGMFSITQNRNSSGASGAGAGHPGQFDTRQYQPGFGGNGSSQFSTWLSACSLGDDVSGRRWIAGGGGGGHASYYGSPYNTNNRSAGGGAAGHGNGTGNPTAAVVNTGGGGGGNGSNGSVYGSTGGAGGSGLAIIRYLTGAMTATGGTIVTSGGYTYHAFTSNGTFARTA